MSNNKKERDIDISDFHYLCKDLYKYIRRRVIKKYIFPEISYKKAELSLRKEETKFWKYFKSDEVKEEDKLCNLFKDNTFLGRVQKFYESLENLINVLDVNQTNFEKSKKEIEIGEKKINILFEVNRQLNHFFNPGTDISLNSQNNIINGKNNPNLISHLSLFKLNNILNDLKKINAINDLNILEAESDNNSSSDISIIYDNIKSDNNYNNKIKKENYKKEDDNFINDDKEDEIHLENKIPVEDQFIINTSSKKNIKNEPFNNAIKEFKFLNKKKKRDKDMSNEKNEKYIDINDSNLINLLGIQNNKENANNYNNQIKFEDKYYKKESNSDEELIEISDNQSVEKGNNQNINLKNSISSNEEYNNLNDSKQNKSLIKYKELEFQKELYNQFSCIFSEKSLQLNKDIIHEIKNILIKIPEIKFPKNKNIVENPSVIGSYKHFDTNFLQDSPHSIDIILKYKDIESTEEIKKISKEIIYKNLGLNYIEISQEYDKDNGIAKIINKCKINIKENDFIIYINLIFVNVNISSYIEKEKCINKFMLTNKIYNNKCKILICLFFRRWRRKYKLFFIIPEFFDIIVDFYYKENEKIQIIIENIFYDLISGHINFSDQKSKIIDDENMNEIIEFTEEWFKKPDYNEALNKAIISTYDYFSDNDFCSIFKID